MKNAALALLAVLPLSASAGTVKYVGSSTVGNFIKDAAEGYKASAFEIDTQPESQGGQQCAAAGTCDVGGVAGDVESKYLDQGVVPTLVGRDAIAIIVPAGNPVKGLTSAQLKGIFTGKITNWSQVGGPDLPIKPYIVKKGSATRAVVQKIVLGGDEYGAEVDVVTPDAKMVPTVAQERGAIGQISFSFLKGTSEVRALAVDDQPATLANQRYPITRPLYLTTKGAPHGEVKAFLAWVLSAEGQRVVGAKFVRVK